MDSNTSRKNSNRKNSNRKNSDRKNSDRKNSDRKASTRSNESGNGKNERKTSSSKRKNSNNSEDGHDLTNLSQEELDALYDSEEEEDRRRERAAAMSNMMDAAAYAAAEVIKLLVDYGPPYEPQDVNDLETLQYYASDPNCNPYNIHRLLNKRIDPNIADEEELYYTPMHWCARNTHLLCARMLFRAKAKIDPENELGQTPLHLCVMVTATPDKREKQFKMIQYLLRKHANINARDKGGYSPIDYAVMSGDQEVVELLLSMGAKVERTNETLVAKRTNILSLVPSNSPEIYKLINERLQTESEELAGKKMVRQQILAIAEDERRHKKLHEQLMKRKLIREAAEKAAAFAARRQVFINERDKKIKEEWDKMAEESKRMKYKYGEWKKVESTTSNHWTWVNMREPWEGKGKLYRESEETMNELHVKYGKEQYEERWKKITGKTLEIKWTKDEKFKTKEVEKSDNEEDDGLGPECNDENDKMLANENLDDVQDLFNF